MTDEADPGALARLQTRLQEAEETLAAIRNGEVDAVVVEGPAGHQVYALENADRPYRVLVERMQEGAVSLGRDGTVLYCNERFATLVGRPRHTLVGHPVAQVFDVDQASAFLGMLAQGQATALSGEFTLRAVDGRKVPVSISLADLASEPGLRQVTCAVVTDLTHAHLRSHELAAANARLAREIDERSRAEDSLQLALDAAGMGYWDNDLLTGTSRRSPRYDEIFGLTDSAEHDLDRVLERFLPDDRDAVARAFRNAETSGLLEFERRIRRGDDEIRWVHMKGRITYQDDRPVRLAGVVADVTDRHHVEEQLRQAQKMEAVGQLTGGIAHDFNNLLTIIGGSLELLGRRVTPDEKIARLLDAARQGVERGVRLNAQLLAFSRRQDLRSESVCVDDLVPAFRHLLERAMGETVTIQIELARVWYCLTDPHQLETAILNLAINARDAMPDGGTLTIRTGKRQVDEELAGTWGAQPGDYVTVAVIDTGVGIPPDLLPRVFEPFFTTKESGKGTGLGLSQVYGLAKQSGGFVTIDSTPGRGTQVMLYLPRSANPAGEDAEEPAPGQEFDGSGIVLLVEDDIDVRSTTSAMLRDLGYAVREAETGRLALDALDAGHDVDVVLSDVVMPGGMSGIELAQALRQRRPALPVLLTSGYSQAQLLPGPMPHGFRLLPKPFGRFELSRAIRDALATVSHGS